MQFLKFLYFNVQILKILIFEFNLTNYIIGYYFYSFFPFSYNP
jgi:hypothetical protein